MDQNTKYFIFVISVFGISSIILQSLLVPLIEITVWQPDLVLVIVLLTGKRFGSAGGSTAGFFLGIVQDSLSGMPVGITAMPKAIAGYFSGKTRGSGQSGTVHYVFFIVLIFLHELITYAFFQYKTDLTYLYLLYSRIFPNSAYTMIMLFIVDVFFKKYFTE